MKRIELEYHEDGIQKIISLFDIILKESDFDLDQFVKGDSLAIPNEKPENFIGPLKEFINLVTETVKEGKEEEGFWNLFEEFDNKGNFNKFLAWLERYVEAAIRPYKEALFIKDMSVEMFVELSNYCFENLILKDIGKKRIDAKIGDVNHIIILRKIMYTFIDMVIVENFSKENVFDNMKSLFGINQEYCEFWWDLVEQKEEKLWRIMVMKQYSRMESKINHLLDILEE